MHGLQALKALAASLLQSQKALQTLNLQPYMTGLHPKTPDKIKAAKPWQRNATARKPEPLDAETLRQISQNTARNSRPRRMIPKMSPQT